MAEKIVNEFTVNRPIDEAWPIICDLERIAPCMPGAQLQEVEGDIYRGVVKVKLGAVTAQFKGEARFVERDDTAHTARLAAKGRDTGGRGNAEADIDAHAEALSPTSTKVTVTANLHITGKVAQFGRGIMGDVSKKLVDQFATNLNELLDEDSVTGASTAPTTAPSAATASSATDAPTASAAGTNDAEGAAGSGSGSGSSDAASGWAAPGASAKSNSANTEQPKVRKIDGPAAEPVDLAGVAGPALVKRVAPIAAVALLVLLLLRRRG